MSLTFEKLREANLKRLPDGSDWPPAQWLQALVGEIGEYANLRKKFERGYIDEAEFKTKAADELADIQIYFDIAAYRCGIDGFGELESFNQAKEGLILHENTSPAQLLCSLISRIAAIMNELSQDNFIAAQITLSALAEKLEIDLGEATREKFNAVSDRIGCDVFL